MWICAKVVDGGGRELEGNPVTFAYNWYLDPVSTDLKSRTRKDVRVQIPV